MKYSIFILMLCIISSYGERRSRRNFISPPAHSGQMVTTAPTVSTSEKRLRTNEDYPGVLRVFNSTQKYLGGGIVINGCVITAAHLIKDNYNVELELSNENNTYKSSIVDIKMCPGNIKGSVDHTGRSQDIAVGTLSKKPPFSYNLELLDEKFCKEFNQKLSEGNQTGFFVGYGPENWSRGGGGPSVIKEDGTVGDLRDGNVKFVGEKEKALDVQPNPQIPVVGDSGGPLFALDSKNNKKLVGIISSSHDTIPQSYSASICHNLEWIKKTLSDLGCK